MNSNFNNIMSFNINNNLNPMSHQFSNFQNISMLSNNNHFPLNNNNYLISDMPNKMKVFNSKTNINTNNNFNLESNNEDFQSIKCSLFTPDYIKYFPLKGLDNVGMTCYMNSTLQCLLHIPELI